MNVHCTTCGELWEVDYLQHEVIFETDLSASDIEVWYSLPNSQKLAPSYRDELQDSGWEFGRSVVNVVHCPCCPQKTKPDLQRLSAKAELERQYGTDILTLASIFHSYNL
ncbi:MAG: hypothetical protein WCS89_02425 [Candidatus Paceibacterota bacterium]